MRVLLDCRMLDMSGIGRYIRDFLTEALHVDGEIKFLLAGHAQVLQDFIKEHLRSYQQRLAVLDYASPIYSVSEQCKGSLMVNSVKDVDVIHIPHYNAPRFLPRNSVVTIHDLIPFRIHHHHSRLRLIAGRSVLANTLRKAGRLIAVSQATYHDILQEFPHDHLEEKTTVIPQGISNLFKPMPAEEIEQFKKRHGLRRYILFVGNRAPHKNLQRLLQAWAALETELPDVELVIVGKKLANTDDVDLFIQEANLHNIQTWERVSDHDLLYLYCGADALVSPSLYEGFGLPPLEAMACGTPVVISQGSALPEVVGDAGIYVNPYDVDDIARGILALVNNPGLCQQLSREGRQRAALFSWENTARHTLAVYRQIAHEMRRPSQ